LLAGEEPGVPVAVKNPFFINPLSETIPRRMLRDFSMVNQIRRLK
jgi:hypothetical protein